VQGEVLVPNCRALSVASTSETTQGRQTHPQRKPSIAARTFAKLLFDRLALAWSPVMVMPVAADRVDLIAVLKRFPMPIIVGSLIAVLSWALTRRWGTPPAAAAVNGRALKGATRRGSGPQLPGRR
jgi:hypothetical protein